MPNSSTFMNFEDKHCRNLFDNNISIQHNMILFIFRQSVSYCTMPILWR